MACFLRTRFCDMDSVILKRRYKGGLGTEMAAWAWGMGMGRKSEALQ